MKDIADRLLFATIASCTCLTKTPDHEWHQENCKYRIVIEAREEILKLRDQLKEKQPQT